MSMKELPKEPMTKAVMASARDMAARGDKFEPFQVRALIDEIDWLHECALHEIGENTAQIVGYAVAKNLMRTAVERWREYVDFLERDAPAKDHMLARFIKAMEYLEAAVDGEDGVIKRPG